ncbi:beta-ketoacyl-ACP reductase [Thermaurantimonas aggregans]|uniref:Beta-ketoacyl-ACP reductase n=1 Tax=Thermaurantimonas aggregans TaxID=2173829 RepID=A0A401XKT0_9FLAO|nr:SDR family oxidoreductase [Thermaurantimonas aggregans]MCX8147932.1 SDR family oxidoreductase [Thermaurantimonas aggregans]GCD77594.1 beta-ketoacyl-ACP reductase [Thermaurantimonas aggregans]
MDEPKKNLLLTGASGGIGRAIIPVLAEAGYKLYLQANRQAEALMEFIDEKKIDAVVVRLSLRTADDVRALRKKIADPIHVLVANAGISRSAPAHKMKERDWQETLDVNLSVPFYLAQSFFSDMRAAGFGRVIFVSSVVGSTMVRGTAAYAASKAGLMGLARALAADWAAFGITANCIAPGYMDAGMIEQIPENILPYFRDKSVQGRLGPADEIGYAIAYLASEKSSFVTGQTLHINGGIV